jgi:hypothetical protein
MLNLGVAWKVRADMRNVGGWGGEDGFDEG